MNKKLFIIVNFAVSAALLYVLSSRVGWRETAGVLSSAAIYPFMVAAAAVSIIFRLGFFPYIWKKILDFSELPAEYRELAKINAASLPLKFLVPFKMSEVVRAAGLKVFAGSDFSTALGSTVLLRAMIFISSAELLFAGAVLGAKYAVAGAAAAVLLSAALIIGALAKSSALEGVSGGSFAWVKNLGYCFRKISAPRLVALNLMCLIFQAGEVLCAALILSALGVKTGSADLLYYVSLMMVATALPVSVQGLGIRESIAILGLAGAASAGTALSFGILQSVVYHVLPAASGALVWLVNSASRGFAAAFSSDLGAGNPVAGDKAVERMV